MIPAERVRLPSSLLPYAAECPTRGLTRVYARCRARTGANGLSPILSLWARSADHWPGVLTKRRAILSYDIDLNDPVTGNVLELDEPHHMKGGTYCLGGSPEASLNITYNYGEHYYRTMGEKGIRTIYGMTGAESLPILEGAAKQLGDDVSEDYWKGTEGNAKRALLQLTALARMRPDGVWSGD